MIDISWWLTPIFSAFTGWFVIRIMTRMLFYPRIPKISGGSNASRQELAAALGGAAGDLFPAKELTEQLTSSENVKKIMPYAEAHVEEFLRVKLPQKMPVIGMFIGDKTIGELKTLFLAELEELFPVVMKSYIGNLENDLDPGKIIRQKLETIPGKRLEQILRSALSKQLRRAEMAGMVIGLAIGLVQSGITLLARG